LNQAPLVPKNGQTPGRASRGKSRTATEVADPSGGVSRASGYWDWRIYSPGVMDAALRAGNLERRLKSPIPVGGVSRASGYWDRRIYSPDVKDAALARARVWPFFDINGA